MSHHEHQQCIQACEQCAQECDHCAVACLTEDDVQMMERCIRLDMDCSQICRLAVAYMSRGSELTTSMCQLCAEVCDTCAEECARHEHDHCQRCAEACRQCAEECRKMAGARV